VRENCTLFISVPLRTGEMDAAGTALKNRIEVLLKNEAFIGRLVQGKTSMSLEK